MTEGINYDQLTHIKAHAVELKSRYSQRDVMFDEFIAMYMMRWSEATNKKLAHAHVVISPDARNSLLGMVRLMIATDPSWRVPLETSDAKTKEISSKIEVACSRIHDQSGKVAGSPIHYDSILSAALYGEMHTAITSTRRLLEARKKSGKDVGRIEQIANLTPFLYECWSPRHGYPEMDNLGMWAYYRESTTTPQRLISEWGKSAVPEQFLTGSPYREVAVHSYWDTEWEAVWTDQGPLRCTEHGLPAIPISVQLTDGSMLFDKPEEQRQPFLYTLLSSRMWNAQNIALTVMFTTVFGMGISPTYVHHVPATSPDKKLVMNFDQAIGIVETSGDETFEPVLNRGLIDPALSAIQGIAERKGIESTIYREALGEPIDRRTSFSEANLLAQSGRLPLVGTQKRGGWGLARVAETAMLLFRKTEKSYRGNGIELKPSEIPDNLQLDVKLEINLPQDRLQLANTINLLTSGPNPKVSLRWALENILGVGQADAMQREIWREQSGNLNYQLYVQQQQQEAALQAQQDAMAAQQDALAAQGGGPGGPGGPQVPPAPGQGGGPQATPVPGNEGGPQVTMAPGQAQAVQGGLPPQQAGVIPAMPIQAGAVRR